MKKVALLTIFAVFVLFSFTNCNAKSFPFKESVDEIESIEIVSAENSLEFTVVKTLSETEKKEFLEEFQRIGFYKYLGDPPKLHGDSIRITYKSGVYEMICSYTSEYVEDGKIQFLWTRCDENDFIELLNTFL